MCQYSDTFTGMTEAATRGRVSDEVWEQIAQQGHPGAAERRVFRRSVAGVLAVLLGAVLVWGSGLFAPVLASGDGSAGSFDPATHTATYEFDLTNRGILPATVVGAATDVPGVTLTSTSPARSRLSPGASVHVRLALEVRDCARAVDAVTARDSFEGPPIEVRVARPWGTVVGRVHSPGGSLLADLVPGACGVDPTG
ncbi:hypothetical protein GCM10027517_36390 [Phycicoccus ginsengisoli]